MKKKQLNALFGIHKKATSILKNQVFKI